MNVEEYFLTDSDKLITHQHAVVVEVSKHSTGNVEVWMSVQSNRIYLSNKQSNV